MHTQTYIHSPAGHCPVIFQTASCILMLVWKRTHTHTHTPSFSAGHKSTAHCDSCRCRNGNFNEVGTAVVVSSPFLVRENGTLSTLPKNGPVISLEIEAKTPVSLSPNNPSPLCVHTYSVMAEVNKELLDLIHSGSALTTSPSMSVTVFASLCCVVTQEDRSAYLQVCGYRTESLPVCPFRHGQCFEEYNANLKIFRWWIDAAWTDTEKSL